MTTRTQRRLAKKQAMKYPSRLQVVPRYMWPDTPSTSWRLNVWLSQDYLVQGFYELGDIVRLTICSTTPTAESWADGLTWDELMEIKRQCGYGYHAAVELYPDDANIVNVSNMRHLWVLPEAPAYMWRKYA